VWRVCRGGAPGWLRAVPGVGVVPRSRTCRAGAPSARSDPRIAPPLPPGRPGCSSPVVARARGAGKAAVGGGGRGRFWGWVRVAWAVPSGPAPPWGSVGEPRPHGHRKLPTRLPRREVGRLWALERHYFPSSAAGSSVRELLQGAPRWGCGAAGSPPIERRPGGAPPDPRAALGRAARGPPAAAHSGAWADVGPGLGGGLGCLDWVRMGLRRSGSPNGRRVPRPRVPSRKPAKTSRPRASVEGCVAIGPKTRHRSRRAPPRVSLSGGRSRSPSSWPTGRARGHAGSTSPYPAPSGRRRRAASGNGKTGVFSGPPTAPQRPARASPRTRSRPLGSRACGRGRAEARPPGRAGRRGRGRARG
jgi:hypothetical protein